VQDQIRLWERETQRVVLQPSHWYSNFEDRALYERARAFAEQRGVLLWDSDAKQQLVVSAAGAGCCCFFLGGGDGWVAWGHRASLVRS
jgi:hypothetical protein